MLSYSDAYHLIKDKVSRISLDSEMVDISNSQGRFLSQDIISDINLPPFNNSAMDGFAIIYADDISTWKIIAEIPAGKNIDIDFDVNECIGIMTGARMPDKADTIIPIEKVEIVDGKINLKNGVKFRKGQHVRYKSEDLKTGDLVLSKNSVIESQSISLLASCGFQLVPVYEKLKIGIISSGDELVEISELPVNAQIRSSNLASLLTQINELKQEAYDFGIVKDDKAEIRTKLEEALNSDIDILITSGGVSVGKYDYIQDVLLQLGAEIFFWKVNIKPGMPLLFCKFNNNRKDVLIFGLPGNPVSSFVNFIIFIKRAINEVLGNKKLFFFNAALSDTIKKKDGKLNFIRGFSFIDDKSGRLAVKKAGSQSSGNMKGLSQSNCLIIVPENIEIINSNEMALCMKI